MHLRVATTATAVAAAAWLAASLGGCASGTAPDGTDPSGEGDADHPVAFDMHAMAGSVRRIVDVSLEERLSEDERRTRTIAELDAIESLASGIDVRRMNTPWTVPWSVLDSYMGAFLYDVGIARSFAAREPANLVPATRLVNSCLACHGSL